MNIKKILTGFLSVFALLFVVGTAHATSHETLFGGAEYVTPGNASDRAVSLVSDSTDPASGVEFEVPDGTTFADFDALSTDFFVESDDACAGGSPRFALGVDTDNNGTEDGNIFVYLGDEPNYTCTTGSWQNSGDLLVSGRSVDTSQVGGTFYDDYDNAVATYGTATVTNALLVVDGSWNATATGGDGEQTVLVDNTTVDDALYTYEVEVAADPTDKDQCKDDGWVDFGFRNQGQCIRFVNTGQDSR